ncbi:gypsy type transposase [Tanacetum coccineum]
MVNCNPSQTPVDTESKLRADGDPVSDLTLYWSLACSLQYFTFTRPDISYDVQHLGHKLAGGASITSLKCVLTQEHLDAICAKYFVPEEVHPQLPSSDATMHERPTGKVGMYTRFFDYANYQMDLNAFIRTADPHKVRIVERARAENERPIVTVAKHRTVTLLPTSVVRSSGELSASMEREFVGDASVGDGGDQGFDSVAGQDNVEPTVPVTEPVKAEIPRPKRSKKKRVTYDSEGLPVASHPPKRLRADYGTTGGSATGGKSPSVLNRLLQDSRLTVEQGVPALPTLPFITSSVTASPLEEGGDRTDSVTGPSLRTIGPSARFVVLSDSSHHSGAKSADPEVDSLVRSAAPVMTEATIVATPADVSKDKSAPHPSVFGSSSSSEKTDRTLSLFTGRSGSGFDAGSIRAEEAVGAGSEEIYVPEWTVTKGFELNDGRLCANMIDHFTPPAFFKTVRGMEHEQLFTEFNVSAARNLSLSSEVRMRAEYNILEKRKWRSLAEEKNILLEAKDKEIEDLKSQLLKAKEESAEVTQLRAQVSGLEATENSLRGEVASAKDHNVLLEQECNSLKLKVTGLESTIAEKDHELSDLGASSSSLKSQNQSLVNQVHELEISSADLREKLEMYEGSLKQLEEFQDNLMGPLRTRLAEIDADFTRCCMRFQESFHPHLLNVVAGRRWLLTHGMKLLVVKCLNSNEYMEALGHAFGRAIEKGMQEGLAAGIEHGQAGRCLTDLEAYIPSAEDDFNSAIRDLRDLNFPLIQELSNKKDVSTWDIMDLLRLDDVVAETLGMTDLQPDVSQLMVPVHHKQDMVVIGSQALSFALDICRGRVEKMERNLIECLPFLKDVFVSIDDPLSAEALIEPSVEVPATNVLSTVVIVPHIDPSVSIEDYDNPDLADVVLENANLVSESKGKIDASARGGLTFSQLDDEARDAVL